MDITRRYSLLIVIIALTALPALSALLLYHVTDNPSLRPLGITHERLAMVEGETDSVSILVVVNWGRDQADGSTQQEFRNLIAETLTLQTDNYVFRFNDVAGTSTAVTFHVGSNRYGPYPPTRLAEGIYLALVAQGTTKRSTN